MLGLDADAAAAGPICLQRLGPIAETGALVGGSDCAQAGLNTERHLLTRARPFGNGSRRWDPGGALALRRNRFGARGNGQLLSPVTRFAALRVDSTEEDPLPMAP